MKKLFIMLTGMIPFLGATNKLNAQSTDGMAFRGIEKAAFANFSTMDDPKGNNESVVNINQRALKNFSKNYKNINYAKWQTISDGFAADFMENGVYNIVYYDTNGNWAGCLKRYPEDKLPTQLKDMLETQYGRYTIDYVSQIETKASNGIPTYVAVAEDKKTIKWIRIFDGEPEEYRVFLKQ